MSADIDPNEWVDTDAAFPDDYNPDGGIGYGEFTLVPGEDIDRLALVFNTSGISFLGARSGSHWGLSIHSPYHYSGQVIPVHDDYAEHILAEVSGTDVFAEYDWAAQDWTYFE